MQGETRLTALLKNLNPRMDDTDYVFVHVTDIEAMKPVYHDVRGMFIEEEGITLIVPVRIAQTQGWHYDLPMRCITCQVHSSLQAVGMTAAMSSALAAEGISANVVAAYYHDHLFIPAKDADVALNVLRTLSTT